MSQPRSVHRLLAVICFVVPAVGCSDSDAPFDRLLAFARAESARQAVPGGAIALVENGVITHQAGFGSKQLGARDPVTADTLFGVGSTTKMLTASAVLTLRDERKLELDAPVTTYLPGLPLTGADPATIHLRHLLDHSSGLPDLGLAQCSQTLAQWFADPAQATPLWSPPGKLWNYSNRGYALLGLLLEQVSGRPYAEAMQERVLAPAGMQAATFDPRAAMAIDHSLGHVPDAQGSRQAVELDTIDCPVMQPAGGAFYASAPDMAHFAQALLAQGAPFLQPDSVAEMEAAQIDTHLFPGETYGFGLCAREAQGTRVVYHDGNDGRFSSMVVAVPSQSFAVVVLLNSGAGVPEVIAQKALDLFLGTTDVLPVAHILANPDDWTTPSSTWTKYTGLYFEPYTYGQARVTLENGVLWGELPDSNPGQRSRLTQVADDTFVVDDMGLLLTFWFDGNPAAATYGVTRAGVFTRVQ
jgi:CubicO group peptidase (beta-lactamase class C family)